MDHDSNSDSDSDSDSDSEWIKRRHFAGRSAGTTLDFSFAVRVTLAYFEPIRVSDAKNALRSIRVSDAPVKLVVLYPSLAGVAAN